jgi:hypothetical protein
LVEKGLNQQAHISTIEGGAMNQTLRCVGLMIFLSLPGILSCTHHVVESKSEVALAPVEIKPIHITIDINIKVDRALDNFFGDIDKVSGAQK